MHSIESTMAEVERKMRHEIATSLLIPSGFVLLTVTLQLILTITAP